jgi:hypothetical protein
MGGMPKPHNYGIPRMRHPRTPEQLVKAESRPPMLTIDARCDDLNCSPDIYRMIGHCTNCGTKDILVLHTRGHKARDKDCPVCGCHGVVRSDRLATDDEFPAAEASSDHKIMPSSAARADLTEGLKRVSGSAALFTQGDGR